MPHIPASQALSRFRVVDMTQVRAGPTAARQLADWGAESCGNPSEPIIVSGNARMRCTSASSIAK